MGTLTDGKLLGKMLPAGSLFYPSCRLSIFVPRKIGHTGLGNRLIRFDLQDLPGYAGELTLWDYDSNNGTELASVCGLRPEEFPTVGTLITCGRRDHDTEFIRNGFAGRSQLFRSELAAFSWNLLQLLVITSCNEPVDNKRTDRSCFDPTVRKGVDRTFWSLGCSLAVCVLHHSCCEVPY